MLNSYVIFKSIATPYDNFQILFKHELVNHNLAYNSPSNSLQIYALFRNYFQKTTIFKFSKREWVNGVAGIKACRPEDVEH